MDEDVFAKLMTNLFGQSESEQQNIQDNKFEAIIASVSKHGVYSFYSTNPRSHDSIEKVESEATRLATNNPGTKFVVFQRIGSVCVEAPQPVWGD